MKRRPYVHHAARRRNGSLAARGTSAARRANAPHRRTHSTAKLLGIGLLPSTKGALEKEIEFERGLGLFSSWKRERTIGDKVARFRQLNVDQAEHHDALEFPNGDIVLVIRLSEGQHATVLQLTASP